MKKIKESDQIEFRGYPFYELTDYGYKFKFNNDTIIEAKNQGFSEHEAYSTILGKFCGMFKRDHLILKLLKKHKIQKVYDVGGDRGGLAQLLKLNGINVTVFEPRAESIEYMKLHDIDCKQISVQELTKNFSKYIICEKNTAILCLNFTHAKWKNELEKDNFFRAVNKSNVKIFIFSWVGEMNNLFSNFFEDFKFNPNRRGYFLHRNLITLTHKLRLSRFINYLNFLVTETEYETMQRCLINKNSLMNKK